MEGKIDEARNKRGSLERHVLLNNIEGPARTMFCRAQDPQIAGDKQQQAG
ncbi:hypothetical protein GGTG_05914 [Gaeumannomyces tritici R3-111a-1]|uniref:Uncharacterized protein n=1 Tax=Gaeumannomyces tritici (strain R3-111a-1) TaxID=644352 RepID=J3NXA7_GAET3|nr:hypothetical protein GGTG_05914 [Gaeumannomyces tritici R3-111a-1]EJT75989.1 hypothetical protein GGTG_05914 [Gaeumannomyces tritici R3-111a-1]